MPGLNDLTRMLQDIAGKEYVTSDPVAAFAYTQDASLFGGTQAAVIVRPGSTEEVSRIMALANKEKVPLVVRGGGASIYGQPKGDPGKNILLDMTRMDKVLSLNKESFTVHAQAGIIMGKLQHACRTEGFYIYAPFAPLHIVSLGGWIAGAAGAASLWSDIVSITVVLPDGTIVKTGAGPGTNLQQKLFYNRNLGGPDFAGLFIGDGGAFGIKTEVTVRISPYPPVTRAAIVEFSTLEGALAMVKHHVGRVNPHPFDPVMVFGNAAMRNFMPDLEESDTYVVNNMSQGFSEAQLNLKRDEFLATAEAMGALRNEALDAMAENMSSGTGEGGMDWLAFFNGLGLAAWMPFTMPREGFEEKYRKLIAWRNTRLEESEKLGYTSAAKWEFFCPTDASTIIGEIDVFFQNQPTPEMYAFVSSLMLEFQQYSHSLGTIDVYNQGVMADINASCWSPGFRHLFDSIKACLDPNGIMNPGLWKA